jgi:Leucine-rich repeat (LRR) protein
MQVFLRICCILLLACSLIIQCENFAHPEIAHIPDTGFLDALISSGVDTDKDGRISYEEAESTEALTIPPSGISDLTGLEAFINLDSFSITLNPLAGINLSANTSLRYLECTSCELNSLDLSRNLLLEELICGRNSLTELDVSQNQALVKLVLNNNLITRLDLSANLGLKKMISCGNKLTRLDISRHTGLELIGVDNMPMLTQVCVWTLPFPPDGIVVLQGFSPNIVYTDQCADF